jgi:hypothetical protein
VENVWGYGGLAELLAVRHLGRKWASFMVFNFHIWPASLRNSFAQQVAVTVVG